MVEIEDLLADKPSQILFITALVAVLGTLHEIFHVRKVGQRSCRWFSGIFVVTVAYVCSYVTFLALVSYFLNNSNNVNLGTSFAEPVEASFLADIGATFVIFFFSVFMNNSSMYDAYWSVFPPLMALLWWSKAVKFDQDTLPNQVLEGFSWKVLSSNARPLSVLIVYFLWGVRLTYNWARGWPGLHHVDWRYVQGPASPQKFNPKR